LEYVPSSPLYALIPESTLSPAPVNIAVFPFPFAKNVARWLAADLAGKRVSAEGGRGGSEGSVGIDILTIVL